MVVGCFSRGFPVFLPCEGEWFGLFDQHYERIAHLSLNIKFAGKALTTYILVRIMSPGSLWLNRELFFG